MFGPIQISHTGGQLYSDTSPYAECSLVNYAISQIKISYLVPIRLIKKIIWGLKSCIINNAKMYVVLVPGGLALAVAISVSVAVIDRATL